MRYHANRDIASPQRDGPLKLIRRRDVLDMTGLSASTVERLEQAGCFPERVRIGPNSVAWLVFEIEGWIEQRAAERHSPAGGGQMA